MATPKNISFFLFPIILMQTPLSADVQRNGRIPPFPAILVFGDSTVDTGNNDYVDTTLKGDHPPYGKNFPGAAATGRCSDGKLAPDILASMIGLKEVIPPFLDPNLSDEDVVTGVCFASAGSGYDDRTTSLSNAIPVSRQLVYFREYIRRLEGILGKKGAARVLEGALVIVSAGTNDLLLNFYDIPDRKEEFTIGEYQDLLLNKLTQFVEEVSYHGCRNILVVGLPPIGCLPIQLTLNSKFLVGCVDDQNEDAEFYNEKLLENVLPQLQSNIPNTKIIYADIYTPLSAIINNPQNYGFFETKKGCCGTGRLEFGLVCSELSLICKDPKQYVFFDSIHPTEAAYKIITETLAKNTLPKFG